MATTTSRRPAVAEPAPRPACDHARGHITDSYFYGNNYATPVSRAIFCDICRVQRWLDVEAALAQAQGELGVIPPEAAAGIVAAARVENIDLESMRTEVIHSRHSLMGLLRGLQAVCPDRRPSVTELAAQLSHQHRRAERAVGAERAPVDVGGAEARRRRPLAGEVQHGAPGFILNVGGADIRN